MLQISKGPMAYKFLAEILQFLKSPLERSTKISCSTSKIKYPLKAPQMALREATQYSMVQG